MWQVTYNPSVVMAPSSDSNVSSNGFKRRWYTNSSATAGRQVYGKQQWYSRRETDIALSADGRILSAVTREGLIYRLKFRTLFFRIIKKVHVVTTQSQISAMEIMIPRRK